MFAEQVKHFSRENVEFKSKLDYIESHHTKKLNENSQLIMVNKEQENVISALKDETSFNKELLVKLKTECDSSREKVNDLSKQVQNLNESLEKEKELNKQLTVDLEKQLVKFLIDFSYNIP